MKAKSRVGDVVECFLLVDKRTMESFMEVSASESLSVGDSTNLGCFGSAAGTLTEMWGRALAGSGVTNARGSDAGGKT